jgi:predicted alpha/beta superfamily hydrolase
MNRFTFFVLLNFIFFNALCQTHADTLHFHSNNIRNGNYTVEITLPPNYDATKPYPVCYFLDLMLAQPLMKNISDSLQRNALVGDYIFVGIKCDDTTKWSIKQRMQDFTPSYLEQMDVYVGNHDSSVQISGGGPRFLAFLKNEIIPAVEGRYKSKTEQRTLFGMSLSGLFAAYVLVEDPTLFSQYIIGAPSLWYDDGEMLNRLRAKNPKKLISLKHVYMGIGDKDATYMVKQFNEFAVILEEKNVKVTYEIYPGKDHVGIWSTLLVKGIKNIFPK